MFVPRPRHMAMSFRGYHYYLIILLALLSLMLLSIYFVNGPTALAQNASEMMLTPTPSPVPPPNQPPVFESYESTHYGMVGKPFAIHFLATDPDGDPITYKQNNLPPGLTINSTNGKVGGIPTTEGIYTVEIAALDYINTETSIFVGWKIAPANQCPAFASGIQNRTNTVGDAISYAPVATDPDGFGIVWSAANLPSGLSIDAATGLISGSAATVGRYEVTLSVTDRNELYPCTTDASFVWTVIDRPPTNTCPVVEAIEDQSNQSGDRVEFAIRAKDREGDQFGWRAINYPEGVTFEVDERDGTTAYFRGVAREPGLFDVTVMVSEGEGEREDENCGDRKAFQWKVDEPDVNHPPVIDQALEDMSGAVGARINLQLSAADADSDTLTWSATGLPTGLEIAPETGMIGGGLTAAGVYSVNVGVSDGNGGVDSASFTWTVVGNQGDCPVISQTLEDRAGQVGDDVDMRLSVARNAGDEIRYTWDANGLPPRLVIEASGENSGIAHISGTLGEPGLYEVTVGVFVSDREGCGDKQTFYWKVYPQENRPPSIDQELGDRRSYVGANISVQLSATDPDRGDSLAWRADGLPTGLDIDPASGHIRGVTTVVGDFNVSISVSDGNGGMDSASFGWKVLEIPNSCPVISQELPDVKHEIGERVAIKLHAVERDGDRLTWLAHGLPAGVTLETNTADPTIAYLTGAATEVGLYKVTVTVAEHGDDMPLEICVEECADSQSFLWKVGEQINHPPVITQTLDDRATYVGARVYLALTATDPDSDAVKWEAVGLPAGVEIDAETGVVRGAPTTEGANRVTIIARDGNGGEARQSFSWTILAVQGSCPVIGDELLDRSSQSGEEVAFKVSAMDRDGGRHIWRANGLPDGVTIQVDDNESLVARISGAAREPGLYEVTVMVSEETDASDTICGDRQFFRWKVYAPVNRPPTFENTAMDQNNHVGEEVRGIRFTATDPEGDELKYAAENLPTGLGIDPSSGVVAGRAEVVGTFYTVITVSDGTNPAVAQRFTWIVSPENQCPVIRGGMEDRSNNVGDQVFVQLQGYDPEDGENVWWQADGLPDGLSLDKLTGEIKGMLTEAGVNTVVIVLSEYGPADAACAVRESFTWRVGTSSTNHGPEIEQPEEQKSRLGSEVSLEVQARDADGDMLRWQAEGLPTGIELVPNRDSGNLAVIHGRAERAGEFSVTLIVEDGKGGLDSVEFRWTVVVAEGSGAAQGLRDDQTRNGDPTQVNGVFLPFVTMY